MGTTSKPAKPNAPVECNPPVEAPTGWALTPLIKTGA